MPDRPRPPSTPERLLTPDEAAKLGGCTPRVLHEMARRGDVPVYRIGKGPKAPLRFKWSELEAGLRSVRGGAVS